MSVGAKDYLDMALVKKYASMRVDNPIVESSMVDPNKMFEAMNDYASMHRSMLDIQQKLRSTCIRTTAMGIKYHKSRDLSKVATPA